MALCPLTVCVVGCSWSFPYFGGFNHYCDDVIQYLLSWLCRQRNFCGQSECAVASEVKPGISMLNFRSHPGNPKFGTQHHRFHGYAVRSTQILERGTYRTRALVPAKGGWWYCTAGIVLWWCRLVVIICVGLQKLRK